MLMKIIDFQVDFQQQEGSKMHLSDTVSRFADFNISIHEVEVNTAFKSLTMKHIASETASDVHWSN